MGWKNAQSGYESSWSDSTYDPLYDEKVKAETERLSAFIGKKFTVGGDEFTCSKVTPMAKYPITAIGNNNKETDFKEEQVKWNL